MKIIYLMVICIFMYSCNNVNINGKSIDLDTYSISTEKIVPDSLKNKQAEFVKETVRAASFHMTGGDYEDPEDVITRANTTFVDIYGIKTYGLYHNYRFTPLNELNETELKIYNILKNK